ncbi:MAG: N4-(beta-N-acetylglucosaminyl)-L-asparaginase, putative [Rhodanobacteraceae bacterium]|jgi:N4-(beta-N-acetylglucosaminyl)-L-asparaginase|nr:MAG: N4-(beta-N-acetylglucosaminyl)-L-asparaginase, putative [Rhodanobacteraceae bacterium]
MNPRRHFLKAAALGTAAAALSPMADAGGGTAKPAAKTGTVRAVSTWDFGIAANHAAWAILSKGGASLDAVEAGARVPEADIRNHSVGLGGYPDRDGHVTLDASIMDAEANCGGVACLEHIEHPVSVARLVMEKTPHVLLVGEGALQFALSQGFKKQNLLTPAADKAWHEWLKTSHYKPEINSEVRDYGAGVPIDKHNHDTIGILALDAHGKLAGACTTSGAAWKMRGRVGDSPIIGAGLYVDGEVGAATSTGMGEEVIRNAGSFLVVELMRQGRTPTEACKEAVLRVLHKHPSTARTTQVAFLAMNKDGEVGGYAIQHGFSYAVCDAKNRSALMPSASVFNT